MNANLPGKTLRRHLIVVAVSAMLPLLVLSIVLALLLARTDQERMQGSLQESARLLGHALDAELERSLAAMRALAASDALARADFAAVHKAATAIKSGMGAWSNLVLSDAEGRNLLSTAVPSGAQPPSPSEPDAIRRVARSGEVYVSDLLLGRQQKVWVVYLAIPVEAGGARYVLSTVTTADYWSRWLAERAPKGMTVSISGRDMRVLARSSDAERTLGKPVTEWYQPMIREMEHGFTRGSGIWLSDVVAAWQRSKVSGWNVNIFTPAAIIDAPMRRTLWLLAGGIGLALLIAGALVFSRSRQLTQGVQQLQAALHSLEGARPSVSQPVTPVREVNEALISAAHTASVLESRSAALANADRRKDEFLATLAHELRGPMAPIRNAVEILKRTGTAQGPAGAARDIIERQVDHMRRLVDDLLDLARITRGQVRMERRPIDLAEAVAGAVEATRPLVQAAGIELQVTLPGEPLRLDADLTRLVQVLSNLIANSAKFTPRGGHAWLHAREEGDWVVIELRDDGTGILPDELPRIFDMFSRAGGGTRGNRGVEGLGIGLALVRGLVEQHGGSVIASSEGRGRGATFTVRLPRLAHSAEAHRKPEGRADHAPRPPARVLVADDLADTADSLAELLRQHGHEVVVAYDGREALALAERVRPDAAILDIGMPGLSGHEVASRIRATPWGRGMTLVALSGWGQAHDRERAAEAGFDFHLTKPADPARLESIFALRKPSLPA